MIKQVLSIKLYFKFSFVLLFVVNFVVLVRTRFYVVVCSLVRLYSVVDNKIVFNTVDSK